MLCAGKQGMREGFQMSDHCEKPSGWELAAVSERWNGTLVPTANKKKPSFLRYATCKMQTKK